jgi:hypothetical protein
MNESLIKNMSSSEILDSVSSIPDNLLRAALDRLAELDAAYVIDLNNKEYSKYELERLIEWAEDCPL